MSQKIPCGDKVKIRPSLILHETDLSSEDLKQIQEEKSFSLDDPPGMKTLKIGGQTVARGKIVKRRGQYFFKIMETQEEKK